MTEPAVPGVEEIGGIIRDAIASTGNSAHEPRITSQDAAQRILDLFAPILAEKEREIERLRAAAISAEERLGEMLDASKEEWSKHGATEMALGQWKARAEEAENGRDEWRRLFREERASYAAFEARALAAEAALAGEREGYVLVPIEPTAEMLLAGNDGIDDDIDSWNYDSDWGYSVEPQAAYNVWQRMIAAIRAQGE